MQLSVIILNYKVPYHLLLCLQSVQKALQNIESEIIVVDNLSEDESCELVKTHFPEVILLPNKKNEGFSKGNNRGVKIAKGENICLLNPDTAVSESVFENVLKFAKSHPDFGAIGVKMIDGTGNFLPESKRNLPTPKVAFQKLLGNSRNYYAKHLDINENGKVEILPGAFMLMKKSRYSEVGGLDEDFFMYGEDIDLSYKFLQAGYANYYFGEESILHFKGESTVKNAEYAERFYGAMRLFYQKHFRKGKAIDLFVNSTLELARFSAHFRSGDDKKTETIRNNYVVAAHQNIALPKGIAKEFQWLPPEGADWSKIENSLLLFDTTTLPFAAIIARMEQTKNSGNHYRILSEKCNFLLGSDHSATKGEVLLF